MTHPISPDPALVPDRAPDRSVSGTEPGRRDVSARRFHRWAAILGFVLLANIGVVSQGGSASLGTLLSMGSGVLGLMLAFGGISMSIIHPPAERAPAGMMRTYTLLVSVEILSFVVAFGLATFVLDLIPAAVITVLEIGWLLLQLRLLELASDEAGTESDEPWRGFTGALLGLVVWIAFLGLCRALFPPAGTIAGDIRLLINILGSAPVAASLGFVLALALGRGAPGLLTWARAGTAYLITIPLLFATARILGFP